MAKSNKEQVDPNEEAIIAVSRSDQFIANQRLEEALDRFDEWWVRLVTETVRNAFPFVNFEMKPDQLDWETKKKKTFFIFDPSEDKRWPYDRRLQYDISSNHFDPAGYNVCALSILAEGRLLHMPLTGRIGDNGYPFHNGNGVKFRSKFTLLPVIIGPDPRMVPKMQEENLKKCRKFLKEEITSVIYGMISVSVQRWFDKHFDLQVDEMIG